jgi:hypothetical protein
MGVGGKDSGMGWYRAIDIWLKGAVGKIEQEA